MDEQRCNAPEVLKNLCTPSAERKDPVPDQPHQAFLKTDRHWQVRRTFVPFIYMCSLTYVFPIPYSLFRPLN